MNPRQRIIFASAYIRDTLLESVEKLNRLVKVLNKPFGKQELIDTIDDKSIYSGLQNMDIDIDFIKTADPPQTIHIFPCKKWDLFIFKHDIS